MKKFHKPIDFLLTKINLQTIFGVLFLFISFNASSQFNLVSIERNSPTNSVTQTTNFQFKTTFNGPAYAVDLSDFVLTGSLMGSSQITSIQASSNSVFLVNATTNSAVSGDLGLAIKGVNGTFGTNNIKKDNSTIDQQSLADIQITDSPVFGQSFTPGASGLLLKVTVKTGVGHSYSGAGTMELINGEGYGGSILATQAITVDPSHGEKNYYFSTPASVVSGNKYTLRFNFPGAPFNTTAFSAQVGAGYNGGILYQASSFSSADLYFKTHIAPSLENLSTTAPNPNDSYVFSPLLISTITINSNQTNSNSPNGSANVSCSGGTPPYVYTWSNGATTQNITNLSSGTYYVTVTDNNGTTSSSTQTLVESVYISDNSPAKLLTIERHNPTDSITSNTNLQFKATFSKPISNYTINDFVGTSFLADSLTVTNVIAQNDSTLLINTSINTSVYGSIGLGVKGVGNIIGSNGITNFIGNDTINQTHINDYLNQSTIGQTFSPINSGTLLSISLNYDAGHNFTGTADLKIYNGDQSTGSGNLVHTQQVNFSNQTTDLFTLNSALSLNSNNVYSFELSNFNGSGYRLSSSTNGNYTGGKVYFSGSTSSHSNFDLAFELSVIDSGNSTPLASNSPDTTQTYTLTSPLMVTTNINSTISCHGQSNGEITGNITGGISPYTYAWSNGWTNATASSLAAGTYTVTVTDNVGLTATASTTISEPVALDANIAIDSNVTCNGLSNGGATASASGGTTPFTYAWSNGATTASITGVSEGTYSVTITDANGCTASNINTITEPLPFTADAKIVPNSSISQLTGVQLPGGSPWTTYAYQTFLATKTAPLTSATVKLYYGHPDPSHPIKISIKAINAVDDSSPSISSETINITSNLQEIAVNFSNPAMLTAGTMYQLAVTGFSSHHFNWSQNTSNPYPNGQGVGSTSDYYFQVIMGNLLDSSSVSCNGNSNLNTLVAVNNGISPFQYQWSTGSTQTNLQNLGAGTYTITVTDNIGCTATNSILITEPSVLVASASVDSMVTCNGFSDGGATVAATGGTAPYTYAWSNTDTSTSITGVTAGTYSVTIQDSNGCTTTENININAPDSIKVGIYATSGGVISQLRNNVFTAGTTSISQGFTANGSGQIEEVTLSLAHQFPGTSVLVQIVSDNGTHPVNGTVLASEQIILTSNFQSHQVTFSTPYSVTEGMNYFLTVNDQGAAGPVYSLVQDQDPYDGGYLYLDSSTSITRDFYFEIFIGDAQDSATLMCSGDSDARIFASAYGPNAPLSYQWSNGDTTEYSENLAAGNYTVTVTNTMGCATTNSILITQPTELIASASVDSMVTCNGFNDGGASASASGGTTPYTYAWSNSATTASITGVTAGTYSVTVTDGNGCTDSASVTIQTALPINQPGFTAVDTLICSGTSTSFNTNTSQVGAEYSLRDASTGNLIGTPVSGTGNGISLNGVSQSAAQNFYIGISRSNYKASNALQFNGSNNAVYIGSNKIAQIGTSDFTIETWVKTTNTSGVLISKNTNCSASNNSFSLALENGKAKILLAGGTGSSDSSGVIGTTLINDGNWHHVAYVRNGNTLELYINGVLDASTSVAGSPNINNSSPVVIGTIICSGGTAFTGALDDVRFWSVSKSASEITASMNSELTGSEANLFGYYNCNEGSGITVTNLVNNTTGDLVNMSQANWISRLILNSTCTANSSDTITVNVSTPIAQVSIDSTVSCNSLSDGGATASATGGTGTYTYAWSNSATNASITGILAGTYSVTITDAIGCTVIDSSVVTQPAILTAATVVDSNVTCNSFNDGGATAAATGGTMPYTYAWSNSATNTSITGVLAGTYSVTITDANGCTATSAVTITEPAALVAATVVDSNISCNTYADGGATASATGGTGAYSYAWSNSATNASITGIMAGSYTVTITDANGCTSTSSAAITQPTALMATAVVDSNISCNGLLDGGATASATGGTAPYNYSWTNSATTASITGVTAGSYSVLITDANGCSAGTSASITEPTALVATSVVDSNVTCNGFSNGGASASATGGTAPYAYAWNNAATTAFITGVAAGNYTVTITDANGCTATSSSTITEPAALVAATVVDSNISCNGLSDGGATASATGGTAPYVYAWNNAATTASITGIVAGTYTVTITDANGCTATSSATITEPNTLVAAITLDSNESCMNTMDGGLTATETGGTSSYAYIWSNGATTAIIDMLTAGTYTVTITDANGCTSSANETITHGLATSATQTYTVCDSVVSPSGMYTWTTSGVYMDTLVNAVGCDSVITTNLTVINATASTQVFTACDGYISPSGLFMWTVSGIYTDVLTNAAGCDSTITIDLTINHSSSSTVSLEACEMSSGLSGTQNWTSSGTYTDVIPNAMGCDSVITVNLTIFNAAQVSQSPEVCKGDSFLVGNNWYTMEGTYIDTLTTMNGCDSIVTTNLTMEQIDVAVTDFNGTLRAENDFAASYQWINCDSNNAMVTGETNQLFTPTSTGNYAVVVGSANCSDTSDCYLVEVVGIHEINNNINVAVYPNPAGADQSTVIIEVANANQYAIVIRDLTGKMVFNQKELNQLQTEINISRFAVGTFFIEIQTPQGSTFTKLVVM